MDDGIEKHIGFVPQGAAIVKDDQIINRNHNVAETQSQELTVTSQHSELYPRNLSPKQ